MSERRLVAIAVLIAVSVAVNLALWRMGATTSLRYTRMMLAGQASADSWRPMARALGAWDRGEPIYRTVFFKQREKFQYPPSSLLLPLAVRERHPGELPLYRALNTVGLWATMALAICTALLAALTWRQDATSVGQLRLGIGSLLAGGAAALFFPVTISYVLGQIQTVVNAAFAAALVCWVLRLEGAAGVAVGLAALVKPHFALLALWGLSRRRWRFAAGAGATLLAGTAAAMLTFGASEYGDYARVLEHIGARGEALYANQTVNGLANRLVQPAEHRGWDFNSYPPPHAAVAAATVATSGLLVAAALVWPLRRGFAGTPLDLAVMWLTVTLASPIAWDHHYGGLLPILVLATGSAWRQQAAWAPPILAVAALITGNLWEPLVDVEAPPWNVVQSYVLAGALLTLGVLYALGDGCRDRIRVGD